VLTTNEPMDNQESMKSAKVNRIDENGNVTAVNEHTQTANNNTASNSSPAAAGNERGESAATQARENARAQTPMAGQNSQQSAAAAPSRSATAEPAGQNARVNRRSGAVGTTGQTNANAGARQLPRTASPLGLYELLSGLSLTGAFGVRQLRLRNRRV
jgi:cobalamin biosynthesis Mg chelatase CobN